MEFTIINSTNGVALIKNNNEKFLAIDSGLKNKAFVGVDTAKLQSLPGLIIHKGEISNWKLQGIREINGTTLFYGPFLEGKSFSEQEITPQILFDLTNALDTIKDRQFPVQQFSLNSVFRTELGEILLFPPLLMDFLNNHRKKKDSVHMLTPWNNPKYSGNKGKAFTIAALAYKMITGELPFPGENEEEIEKLMYVNTYRSPHLKEPLLKKEISTLIDDSFSGKGDLKRWLLILSNWLQTGLSDVSLTESDKNRILARENKKETRRINSNKIISFFNKYKNKLLIGTLSLVLLIAIIQTPLSKYLEPPITIGMDKEAVINLFYNSYKSLDTEIMDDCITKKAGKGDINEISTIYVTSKVRTSFEGTSGLMDPEEWKSNGMNPLEKGLQVWGIAELSLKKISTDIYEVSYEKWTPAIAEGLDDENMKMPVGYKITDTVHLSIIRKAWKIDQLERVIDRLNY